MNRIDRVVIAGLVLIIAIAAFAIGGPALTQKPVSSAQPSASPAIPYREGVLSRPTNVDPLAARTQADRDLVALAFEGLVGRGPDGRPVPALATSWTSTTAGDSWTFTLAADHHWHDGVLVTADDVAFTIATLEDARYRGPGAGSWTGITVTVVDRLTVRFDLATPIGGMLDLATQPIVPRHLLSGVAPGELATAAFGSAPVGSGPYRVDQLDRDHAVLVRAVAAPTPSLVGGASAAPSGDPLVTPGPTPRPDGGRGGPREIDLRFFDDAAALGAAFQAGDLDAVSGLGPAAAATLAATPGARAISDPGTTLAAIVLNLRPTEDTFADPRTRQALLEAIDRPRIIAEVYGGGAVQADGLIPPSSWAFDASASPAVGRNLKAAAKALGEAGWKKAADGWHFGTEATPRSIELRIPSQTSNPTLFAVGSRVAADWTTLGFTVTLTPDDPVTIATDHLRTGDFKAALVDIAIGHDPDLYPLLASSQVRTGGANVIGLQDPLLDDLLVAARVPGTDDARKAAFAALQKRLAGGTYLVPIAWPDSVFVLGSRVSGPSIREVADGSERFGDVLTWRLADGR